MWNLPEQITIKEKKKNFLPSRILLLTYPYNLKNIK